MQISIELNGNLLTRLENEKTFTNKSIDEIINNAIITYIKVSALEYRQLIDIDELYKKYI